MRGVFPAMVNGLGGLDGLRIGIGIDAGVGVGECFHQLTGGDIDTDLVALFENHAVEIHLHLIFFNFPRREQLRLVPALAELGADKVLVTPTWKIEGAVAKVEACNNGFDAVPTWEDITAMVQINRVYNFTNKTKTASKWGVNIRFTITKNEGFEGEVSISGFGGAYE